MRFLCYSLLGVILLGCAPSYSGAKENAKKRLSMNQPSWYGLQSSNQQQLIFYGSGRTLVKAKLQALSDLTQQLQVTVKSETQFNISTHNDNVDERLKFEISTDSPEVSIPTPQWLRTEQHANRFWIEAAIDKEVLIAQLKRDLSEKEATLGILKNYSEHDAFAHYIFIQKQKPLLNSAAATAHILTSMCRDFCDNVRVNAWLAGYQRVTSLPSRTCIKVDKNGKRDVEAVLETLITQAGFVNRQGSHCILLSGEAKKDFFRGESGRHVKGVVRFQFHGDQSILYSGHIDVIGHSSISYQDAWQKSLKALTSVAKPNGLFSNSSE